MAVTLLFESETLLNILICISSANSHHLLTNKNEYSVFVSCVMRGVLLVGTKNLAPSEIALNDRTKGASRITGEGNNTLRGKSRNFFPSLFTQWISSLIFISKKSKSS